jgi:DNA mismatch endonuclease, patch repair protein
VRVAIDVTPNSWDRLVTAIVTGTGSCYPTVGHPRLWRGRIDHAQRASHARWVSSSARPRAGWVSTDRGRHLAKRKNEGTVPEVLLRKALHAAGARFRLHRQLAKGCTPDLVLPGRRLAIFVDGCFWHGCPKHGRKTPWAGPNASLWEEKMSRNRERDERSTRLAVEAGWTVMRVWECEVSADPGSVAESALTGGPPPNWLGFGC